MSVSITIQSADDNQVLGTVYRDNMTTAMKAAYKLAAGMMDQFGLSDVYLRDCLGGLRAEMRKRDGEIHWKIT